MEKKLNEQQLDVQQLVAKDLNEVLQLNPQIDINLEETELEEQIKANAGEVYYKHPEHGTDALQESTFAYLLEKGYLVEPEPVTASALKKGKEKTKKPVKEKPAKTEKSAGEKKKRGFTAKPEVAERKAFIEGLIAAGKYTAKEIVEKTLEKFPTVTKSSISTLVSDSKNEKYTAFDKVAKQDAETKIMSF